VLFTVEIAATWCCSRYKSLVIEANRSYRVCI